MLLSERLRNDHEKLTVKQILEKHMKVTIDTDNLYSIPPPLIQLAHQSDDFTKAIVWTTSMTRLYALVNRCLQFKEPVLLVGETGCGKTTVGQLYSKLNNQFLHMINCHQNSETADFLGGYRPVRKSKKQQNENNQENNEKKRRQRNLWATGIV